MASELNQTCKELWRTVTARADVRRELAHLPLLPNGEWIRITDSHDITGFNDDGFSGTYSYLYKTKKGWVLFDHKGAGCIYLIRSIGFKTSLQIYIDQNPESKKEPKINLPFAEVYSGKHPDFPPHLVANSDKGHGSEWSFVPIPFKKRCTIIADEKPENPPHFYNIFAHIYRAGDWIKEKSTNWRLPNVLEPWSDPEQPPKSEDIKFFSGTASIASQTTQTLINLTQAGTISWIRLKIPNKTPEILEKMRIRAYWDHISHRTDNVHTDFGHGGPDIQVDAPIGLFFAHGFTCVSPEEDLGSYAIRHTEQRIDQIKLGRIRTKAVPVGELENGTFYCYFPMPFWTSARIELVNTSSQPVENVAWEIGVSKKAYPYAAGHFWAIYRQEDGTLNHRDYIVAEMCGTGRYVGCVTRFSSRKNPVRNGFQRGFLEGDARFYIDDGKAFLSASTGTEEYFNWGWYDVLPHDGVFTFPTHGYPEHIRDLNDHTTMYRFHITDNVPYYRSFRFEIEHGPNGMWLSNYRSVAFLYHCPDPLLILTDKIDVESSASEEAHRYYAKKIMWTGRKTMPYEGNTQVIGTLYAQKYQEDLFQIEGSMDDEHAWDEMCEFDVKINPSNEGIKIRKRYSGNWPEPAEKPDPPRNMPVIKSQEALVLVDGEPVGIWYLPRRIARPCWMEDDFEIPEKYTEGKDKIHVRLENRGEAGWNAATYWIFSYIPRKWQA